MQSQARQSCGSIEKGKGVKMKRPKGEGGNPPRKKMHQTSTFLFFFKSCNFPKTNKQKKFKFSVEVLEVDIKKPHNFKALLSFKFFSA